MKRLIIAAVLVSLFIVSSSATFACAECSTTTSTWFECENCCLDAYEDCKDANGGSYCGVEWAECSITCGVF